MKLLVISNNILSKNNANGKATYNYLSSFCRNDLLNFYISNEKEDKSLCYDLFHFTNQDALNAFLHKKIKNETFEADKSSANSSNKTAFKHIVRYLVWKFGFKYKKQFYAWIRSNKPDCIFFVLGDNPYLMELCCSISNDFNIPLVCLICEDYPLKQYDYISHKVRPSILYHLFHNLLLKKTRKLLSFSRLCIFNTNELADTYNKEFKLNNYSVHYQASSLSSIIKCQNNKISDSSLDILYAGNTGLNRWKSLVDVADKLLLINPDCKLKIFGKADSATIDIFKNHKNIIYGGIISNEELEDEIRKCYALIHVEDNSDYTKIDLKHAFSTKLADMICSNKRFLLYAPEELAEAKYFKEHLPNNLCTENIELAKKLEYLLSPDYSFVEQTIVKANHTSNIVSKVVKEEIIQLFSQTNS